MAYNNFTPGLGVRKGEYRPHRDARVEERMIHGRKVLFAVEEPLQGFAHACTPSEIAEVLSALPPAHLEGVFLVVLHQPSRKEEILSAAWARYWEEIEFRGRAGGAIFITAINPQLAVKWPISLTPFQRRTLALLEEEGHIIERDRREICVFSPLDAARRTQLGRSLLHEVGHHVDLMSGEEQFRRKGRNERERFADRYAVQHREAARRVLSGNPAGGRE